MCKKITTIALSALSVVLAGALLWSQLDFYRYRRRTDDTLSRNAATIAAQAATIDASIPTSLVLDIAVRYALNPDALQKLFTDRLFYYDDTGVAWAPIDPSLPQNPLDFSLVQNEDNGLKTYSDTNGVQGMQGIDVSSYQGAIQWDKVKAAGIDFAVIRVGVRGWGDGALHLDTQFVNNIKGAQKAGVQIGLYFYSAAINTAEAAAEADFVLAQIKRYNISVTFPVAFDLEENDIGDPNGEGRRTKGLTPTGVTDNTLAFCDRIAAAGYTPAVYGDTSWFMFRTEFARLTKYTIWFHQYVTNPFFPYALGMWQYTKSGTVPGIGVAVDRNMAFRRADGSFLWAGQ